MFGPIPLCFNPLRLPNGAVRVVFAVNHSSMPRVLSANRVSGGSFSGSDEAVAVGEPEWLYNPSRLQTS